MASDARPRRSAATCSSPAPEALFATVDSSQWGTGCDNGWGIEEMHTVCHQPELSEVSNSNWRSQVRATMRTSCPPRQPKLSTHANPPIPRLSNPPPSPLAPDGL